MCVYLVAFQLPAPALPPFLPLVHMQTPSLCCTLSVFQVEAIKAEARIAADSVDGQKSRLLAMLSTMSRAELVRQPSRSLCWPSSSPGSFHALTVSVAHAWYVCCVNEP